jgi:hypothetical protein
MNPCSPDGETVPGQEVAPIDIVLNDTETM